MLVAGGSANKRRHSEDFNRFLLRCEQGVRLTMSGGGYTVRDRVIFLLSLKAGLRAKEIASLTWTMVTDAEGALADTISLTDIASKGRACNLNQ